MATETPNDMVSSSSSVPAGSARSAGEAYIVGVAFRPTLLFMTAFALNVTPHEAAHAVASYMLGFNSTLYQRWVNPTRLRLHRDNLLQLRLRVHCSALPWAWLAPSCICGAIAAGQADFSS
jgi:hypothetical protein